MSQQPEAEKLAYDLDTEYCQGRITNHTGRKAATELRRLHFIEVELRAQVERLQAAGQVVAPELIARVNGWRCSGDSEWARGVNSGIDAAVGILLATNTTHAQEAADTGADERMAFERAARCCAFIKDLQRFPDDYWDKARAGKYGHYETEKARTIWLAALSYAAIAARAGQVAASATARMTGEQRADALDAAIFGCPTIAVVAAFSKGITAAEKFHGIGLTVGGKASGRVGK